MSATKIQTAPVTFNIDGARLYAALEAVRPIIHRRNAVPILSCVRITGSPEGLTFTGTNLDATYIHTIEGDFPACDIAVHFHDLYNFVRVMKWSGFTIEATEQSFRLLDFLFAAGDGASFAVRPALDFPSDDLDRKWEHEFTIDPADLKRITPAISTEETRYYLNGAYLENRDGWLRYVATDGHRLMMLDTDTAHNGPSVIVPRPIVHWINSLKKAVTIAYADTHLIRIISDKITVIAKLIDGKFPEYKRIMPQGPLNTATFNRAELLRLIDAAIAVRASRSSPIGIEFSTESATIRAKGNDVHLALSIPIEVGGTLPKRAGYNGTYLKAALSQMHGETITMQMIDDASPNVITEDNLTQVVMPMRV